ncbi:MAG: pyruvate dehydrogenase [Anaerolineales bacterium]|nr:pyruvate dehydrogenase [Anaerolineales bacterium]
MPDWNLVARLVLTARAIDTLEETELAPNGKITYQFSSKGHELAQILLGLALDQGHDAATVYYRSRPFMLASGLTPRESFAADMALAHSPSEGRDVGVVYSMQRRLFERRERAIVLPASGDVGAQYTPAAGWAQAVQYHQRVLGDVSWEGAIAVALGGDGSVASNGFWAALTMATTLRLPMLFFIEDNGYGISVPRHFQTPGGNIAANLKSFNNLHILEGPGYLPPLPRTSGQATTAELIADAVAHVRAGTGPCLLRLTVPRLQGHTFGEDQTAYKTKAQIEAEQEQDPLILLQEFVKNDFDWYALEAEVNAYTRREMEAALNFPNPDPAGVEEHLFATSSYKFPRVPMNSPELIGTQGNSGELAGSGPRSSATARINMIEAIRRTLETELERDPRVTVFGEDVGPRGGVHRATLGLQARFGETRVFDTSLSEEGIIGRAGGMAMAGLRPVPEIQFRKYADPAYEQIHDLGWVRWRTAGKFTAPVVVRMPVGYSRRTGDPWHSVVDEVSYAHMQGWRLAFPSNAADAVGLLRTALRGEDPTIFFEHRALYDTPPSRRPYPGDDFTLPFGVAARVQEGKYLTVVSWGETLHRCVEAAQPFGDDVEILDLRTIIPWDRDAVLASVRKTGKLLIAHEDTHTAGFGGEISATVAEEAFTDLDAPIQRVCTRDVPIPYNIPMMNVVIPGVETLRKKMKGLLEW